MNRTQYHLMAALVLATLVASSCRPAFAQQQALQLPPPPVVAAPVAAYPDGRIPPAPPPAPAAFSMGAQFADGLRIQDFARVVLQDVLKAQFIFSSEFLSDASYVGFSAHSLKKTGSEALLKDVLAQHGFSLDLRSGYYRISRLKAEDRADTRVDFVYRLKHRDLGYLSSQLQPLFGTDGFTHQRTYNSGQQQQSGSRPADDGRSLYSMTSNTNSNVLVFRGQPAEVERLKGLLEQLDVPVPKILVRAAVVETRKTETKGYSMSGVASLLSGKLNLSLPGSTAGSVLSFSGSNFDAVLSALQGDSSVKVTSSPSVFVQDGKPANLLVGAKVPTATALVSVPTSNSNSSNPQQLAPGVAYQETGTILRVTPVVREDAIEVVVEQEISEALPTTTGVSSSPTITQSSINTTFNLKSGDTVLLGGLSLAKSSKVRDSLPFWRRVTLGDTSSESESELVIVLYVEQVSN